MLNQDRTSVVRGDAGVALIEVLVTMLIIALSLLGLVGISARANVNELESYQRVQALLLAQDMADRMNANRGNSGGPASATNPTNPAVLDQCYAAGDQLQVGTGYTGPPACTVGTAQQNKQAIADILAWDLMLKGSAETAGTSKVGAMIGAVGCIKLLDAANHIYLVSVHWQGLASTAAPGAPTCASGLYGNEKLHRMVSTVVQIGKLS